MVKMVKKESLAAKLQLDTKTSSASLKNEKMSTYRSQSAYGKLVGNLREKGQKTFQDFDSFSTFMFKKIPLLACNFLFPA